MPDPALTPGDPDSAAAGDPAAASAAADPSPEPDTAVAAFAFGTDSPDSELPRPPRWVRFGIWRRSRPFWGGLLAALGGGEIIFTYKAPLKVILHFGLYGLAGYMVPIVMVLCGLLMIFEPQHRSFYAVLEVFAALGSWLTSNLGGFIVGMLLGLIGGSLAFGWKPGYGGGAPRTSRAERRALRHPAER